MSKLSIPELIMSINSDLVYMSDINTYEVIYINKALLNALGNPIDSYWKSTPCYRLFHNFDEPCEFCTNHLLKEDRAYTWTHHNQKFDTWFTLHDKKIIHEGKNLRLEVAREVNDIMKSKAALADLMEEERILVDCVTLIHSQTSPSIAVQKLLEAIASFHAAERAFVFEINEENNTVSNTYEWCANSIEAQMHNLQALPIADFYLFLDALKGNSTLHIKDIEKDINRSKYRNSYEILKKYNIESIIITSINNPEGKITGLLGVDNPKSRTYAENLLTPISYFISELQEKQSLLNQLHKSTYQDALTDLKNITSYRNDLEMIDRRTPKSCGVACIEIHDLKKISQIQGNLFGDTLIKKLAYNLRDLFLDHAYRIGNGEFVVLQTNCSKEEFIESLARLESNISLDNDLKIALGSAWTNNFDNGILPFIKDAENEMVIKKKEFYSNLGFDRRSR